MPTKNKVGRPISHMAGKPTWEGKRLYKVLETRSIVFTEPLTHPRGRYSHKEYRSLPKNGKPSKWYRVTGKLEMCRNGYHITTDLKYWHKDASDIFFEVEYQGEVLPDTTGFYSERKFCCRAIRLIRQVWLNDKGKIVRRKPVSRVPSTSMAAAGDTP